MSIEEELKVLDTKLSQLRLGYEQYFMGSRPREPVLLRNEVEKAVIVHANTAILNTAARFKFNSICSRYQAFKRQWNETLRKIEQGTYSRHRFRADLHARERSELPAESAAPQASAVEPGADPLFDAYVAACRSCGQDVKGLTSRKLSEILSRQEQELRQRYRNAEFRFRVVVEDGRAKLKASRVPA